jgi:drug/metabolite transporter (DMT)-like permease
VRLNPYFTSGCDSNFKDWLKLRLTQQDSEQINVEQSAGVADNKDYFLLNFVAVLFGTQHVVIKSALTDYSSSAILNLWRFSLSTLLFSPSLSGLFSLKDGKLSVKECTVRAGMELGLWTFLGFGFQSIGLETTTASRSAFLLYLNVKFVPFLGAVLFKKKISSLTWVSASCALAGTYILANDGAPPNIGDLWCIAAAAASAMFILRLEIFSQQNKANELNIISFLTG